MDYKPIILKPPNIALQDEHSVFPVFIVFIATYPDTNNKGDKSSSLTHNIYGVIKKCVEELCAYFAWLYIIECL